MPIDLAAIRAAADAIRDQMGEGFDDETFEGTLEGETNVMDLLDWAIRKRAERRAMAEAVAALIVGYGKKQAAHEHAADGLRDLAGAILAATGQAKIKRPGGTVSFAEGRVSVAITAADDVPTQLCRVTKTPDKTAIRAAIEAGEQVPGAELVKGPTSVRIS